MSPEARNESVMDAYETFHTFAVQGDASSAERELNGMRERPLLTGLSFPQDDADAEERDCQNLSGRILEANVQAPEFYGLLTHGFLSKKPGINNVVEHHGYCRKDDEALEALALHQHDVAEVAADAQGRLRKIMESR